VQASASVSYRASEFAAQLKDGTLALAEGTWSRFPLPVGLRQRQGAGVLARPWWYDSIITAATTIKGVAVRKRAACPPYRGRRGRCGRQRRRCSKSPRRR
jgi:hypothetical protein